MSINQFTINFSGQMNIVPRFGHLYAPNNTLAEITAAGYLDLYIKSQGFSVLATDIIGAVGSDGTQWYKPVITQSASGQSVQLTALP